MSFKTEQGLDEPNLDHSINECANPTHKKSLKQSFFSNFKSKSKSKTKISTSPSSQSTIEDDKLSDKSFDKSTIRSIDDDIISSDIYPLSTYSTSSLDNSIKIIRKDKTNRQKPMVSAFINGSSFSSSTSSSPPSPPHRFHSGHYKFSKYSLNKKLPEQNELNYLEANDEDDDDDEDTDENPEIDTTNSTNKNFNDKKAKSNSQHTIFNSIQSNHHHHHPHHHHHHHHHNHAKPKYGYDKLRSKVGAGVCTASTSFSLNSDYDEEDFMDAFRVFDIDGDGRITAKELKNVLRELGIKMSKQDIKKMIKELDKDGNGTIEYSEFVQMMTVPASRDDDEFELREAFKCIDLDGNGFISREELKDAVKKIMSTDSRISVQDVEEMMKEADTDGNGLIDFDEFVRVLVEKSFIWRMNE